MLRVDQIKKALEFLQPPSITDDDHQAHWWNEGEGEKIKAGYRTWIDRFSREVVKCTSMTEVNNLLGRTDMKISLPSMKSMDNRSISEFWLQGFGSKIKEDFLDKFAKFIKELKED